MQKIKNHHSKNKRKGWIINLALLLIVCTICFFMAEFLLREFESLKEKKLGYYGEGLYLKSNITKNGYVLKPDNNVTKNGISYFINSDGLRDKEYNVEKGSNTFRTIVLGDSVSFGGELNAHERFPEYLEESMNGQDKDLNYEVLNFGISGYSSYQEIELFKVKGLKYKPDLVIVGYVLNDVVSDSVTKEDTTLKNCKINLINLPINCKVKNLASSSIILRKIRDVLKSHEKQKDIYIEYHNDPERWSILTKTFEELKELSEANDFEVVVVIIPVIMDYENYKWLETHKKLAGMFHENGFSTIDIYETFKMYNPESLKLKEGDPWHPNHFGHKLIADAIFDRLIKDI